MKTISYNKLTKRGKWMSSLARSRSKRTMCSLGVVRVMH